MFLILRSCLIFYFIFFPMEWNYGVHWDSFRFVRVHTFEHTPVATYECCFKSVLFFNAWSTTSSELITIKNTHTQISQTEDTELVNTLITIMYSHLKGPYLSNTGSTSIEIERGNQFPFHFPSILPLLVNVTNPIKILWTVVKKYFLFQVKRAASAQKVRFD